jgi:hypothetical protein
MNIVLLAVLVVTKIFDGTPIAYGPKRNQFRGIGVANNYVNNIVNPVHISFKSSKGFKMSKFTIYSLQIWIRNFCTKYDGC